MSEKIVAIIPARSGSKRVPKKNIREFLGIPLISYSIRAAKTCKAIDRIIVSSDSEEIRAIAEKEGAEYFERPAELASDTASTFDALKHVYAELDKDGFTPTLIVLLQPTSPLRAEGFIDSAISKMVEDKEADSLVSVFESRLFTGKIDGKYWVPDFPEDTRSQDIPPHYVPTGSMYIYRCAQTILKDNALGKNTLPIQEDAGRLVNIDYEHDFQTLELVYNRYRSDYEYLTKL